VLLPVLDDAKHYWVAPDEIDKLLRAGAGWLADHPERDTITRRYLAHRRALTDDALARLAEAPPPDSVDLPDVSEEDSQLPEAARRQPLAAQRRAAVLAALTACGATSVVDLGCGSGALLAELVKERHLRPPAAERSGAAVKRPDLGGLVRIVGADVSARALELAARRLGLDRLPERQRERIALWQSALTYRDDRLRGFDAAVLMEVIEHVDPPRLPALEAAVFGHARPGTVLVTTPNVEYNARYEGLAPGELRHSDHRFEWTRAQFSEWAAGVAERHGYTVAVDGVGDGAPTQLAIFTRGAA
jgi:SAM-dependent methyltransferase